MTLRNPFHRERLGGDPPTAGYGAVGFPIRSADLVIDEFGHTIPLCSIISLSKFTHPGINPVVYQTNDEMWDEMIL